MSPDSITFTVHVLMSGNGLGLTLQRWNESNMIFRVSLASMIVALTITGDDYLTTCKRAWILRHYHPQQWPSC